MFLAHHKSCLRSDTVGDSLHPSVRQKDGILASNLKIQLSILKFNLSFLSGILAGDLAFHRMFNSGKFLVTANSAA